MARRKKKRRRINMQAAVIVTVTALIVSFLGIKTVSLIRADQVAESREAAANAAYEEESQRGELIQESLNYIHGNGYFAEIAKSRLNMDYPEGAAEPETDGKTAVPDLYEIGAAAVIVPGSAGNSVLGSTESAVKGNTGDAVSENTGNAASGNTGNVASGNTGNAASGNTGNAASSDTGNSGASQDSAEPEVTYSEGVESDG